MPRDWDREGGNVPARIAAISLTVADLPRAVRFYRDGFGWEPTPVQGGMDDHVLFLLQGSGSFVLYLRPALIADSGLPDPGPSSLEVVLTYECVDRAALATLRDALLAHGGKLVRDITRQAWGGDTVLILDPDGHLWELAIGLGTLNG
jgi:uncharacterized protein